LGHRIGQVKRERRPAVFQPFFSGLGIFLGAFGILGFDGKFRDFQKALACGKSRSIRPFKEGGQGGSVFGLQRKGKKEKGRQSGQERRKRRRGEVFGADAEQESHKVGMLFSLFGYALF
jgi:hypothetical protein